MIEFRTLGAIDLRDPARGALHDVVARRKLVAILTYLLLVRPPGFCSRDILIGVFWPESSQKRARRALNQAIYELRRSLGEEVIVSRGTEEVGLDGDRIWCDAQAFEDALGRGDPMSALGLYRGALLGAFFVPGVPEFERWLDERRMDLEERALRAAHERARELALEGNRVEAAYWLRQALRWEPYDERALRKLLAHLLALGDRTGALREYQAFARRLEEIDVEPALETRNLMAAIPTIAGDPRRHRLLRATAG
ncbi:MAG TPA: BTAD domain-containing putative transcriptional regulator [Longimicrobiaceae bacterium]|nr:BTAD domain-containing putative transcriptional regulator [Longimicrobiaceae bacterium]